MLKNIKSYYITKIVFLYIDEKQKLKLVKYNKNLQKYTDINIINYKHFTGNYIIYESNKLVKEYSGINDNLIYEGEYLNGQRSGKGKEYQNNRLIFEGEYFKGKRHGKGKEYLCVDLFFEGEFSNGKRNGKGKAIYPIENLIFFNGEYLNDKEWIGTRYNNNGSIVYILKNNNNGTGAGLEYYYNGEFKFKGEYLNGKRNGKGIEYYNNGKKIFEGEYLNDLKWNGKGYDPSENLIYELKNGKGYIKEYNKYEHNLEFEGEYLNGQKNGKGKEYYYNNKIKFEGEYLTGKKNGKGKEYDLDGVLEFEGEYLNGQRNGKGKEYYNNKLIFEGEYLYDYKIKGKLYINEKLEFEGEYLYNKKWNGKGYDENGNIIYELINGNGKVKEYYNDCQLRFEGEYLNGKKHGNVKEYFSEGKLSFEGEYLNGKRNGKGKEYNINGKLRFEGEYLDGKIKKNISSCINF